MTSINTLGGKKKAFGSEIVEKTFDERSFVLFQQMLIELRQIKRALAEISEIEFPDDNLEELE